MDFITQQNQLMHEAEICLDRILVDLKSAIDLNKEEETGEGGGEIDNFRTLQLILQFRLDTQDALQRLFQYSQSVWQILGVSSQYSSSTNKERLAFALGSDDLYYALSMLNRLIDSLLRVLQRYYLSQATHKHERVERQPVVMRPPANTPRLYQKMVRLVDYQKSFIFILNQLTNHLEAIAGQPVVGPILDCICKLEGPISSFYQALQNGMVLSGGLYEQFEATYHLNKKLDELVLEAGMVLAQSPQLLDKSRLLSPSKVPSSSEELEARAAEKRLGHFFRPPSLRPY